jgi:hypothetical protein
VNRRSFLSFLGLAPLAAVTAAAAATETVTIIGIDGGGADDRVSLWHPIDVNASDLTFIASR